MAWLWLLVASALEISWAIGLKYSDGLTRFWPTALTVLAMLGSFGFLSLAVREIPLGTGYALWTGIGAAGTALAGIVLFDEPAHPGRLFCLALVLAGIVGLKLTANG